ncbi:MAG: DNA-binding protein, partial [Candidatus Delongbacteria bacterium]
MAERKNTKDIIPISSENIKNLIHTIRGKQVMIDSDLAILYGVTTGNLNKAMKRNEDRFPDDFCFELTKDEYKNLMFQNGISSSENNYGGRRKMPKAYTEQGISMLSAVLRSEVATKVSITIMRTFVEMR